MQLEQIQQLLEKNDWYKLDGEDRFIAKDDIYLGIHFDDWNQIEESVIPYSLESFVFHLGQNHSKINSIHESKATFFYDTVKLNSLRLFKFSCNHNKAGTPRIDDVYFTVPSNFKKLEKLNDIYCLSLIKFLNNSHGHQLIKDSFGDI
ncbi:hypothetical protein [Acinetobacter nosocomialis]|uniref:hypothetical protein n=1 Tax=Acinetobacter nosocomialis TaxID=106654 RepID=UPI0005EACFA5|nr:hypothetical protein [Acinetobacter nosocomialis]